MPLRDSLYYRRRLTPAQQQHARLGAHPYPANHQASFYPSVHPTTPRHTLPAHRSRPRAVKRRAIYPSRHRSRNCNQPLPPSERLRVARMRLSKLERQQRRTEDRLRTGAQTVLGGRKRDKLRRRFKRIFSCRIHI
jgi:hypothetical protein